MTELILFTLSALPVLILGINIYKKDKNKETSTILTKLFLGGILSVILVFLIGTILELIFPILNSDFQQLNLFELIIYVFIGIALVEEFSKWIVTYKISYNSHEFEEIYDVIVYSVFVALGFAFFENLLYVYSNGIGTGILRALLAVPGHVCDGIFMGYYLGLSKLNEVKNDQKSKRRYLIFSILAPTILHGIYDYCLLTGKITFLIVFIIFVIAMYINSIKKVKKISTTNIRIKYKNAYCTICGHRVENDICPICGRINERL